MERGLQAAASKKQLRCRLPDVEPERRFVEGAENAFQPLVARALHGRLARNHPRIVYGTVPPVGREAHGLRGAETEYQVCTRQRLTGMR